jgi:hypothetical protein
MSAELDIEARWSELFAPLSAVERRAVVNALISGQHEGWMPDYADVATLIDVTRGVIDDDQYALRTQAAVTPDRPSTTTR